MGRGEGRTLTDSGPEREGDGSVGRCVEGRGEDERDEVDGVLGEDKGRERWTKEGGREMNGRRGWINLYSEEMKS